MDLTDERKSPETNTDSVKLLTLEQEKNYSQGTKSSPFPTQSQSQFLSHTEISLLMFPDIKFIKMSIKSFKSIMSTPKKMARNAISSPICSSSPPKNHLGEITSYFCSIREHLKYSTHAKLKLRFVFASWKSVTLKMLGIIVGFIYKPRK